MKHKPDDLRSRRGHRLRDYWTQGTIASLCDALSQLGGDSVELRDERGHVLEPGPETKSIERPIPEDAKVYPIRVHDETLGSVVVAQDSAGPEQSSHQSGLMNRIGELIALTAGEMCSDVSNLRDRVSEVGVLYRLSAQLVQGGRVNETLRLTLELALEVLGLDAGAIMLLPENAVALPHGELENELERSAAIGLSEGWLGNPIPLSKDRQFDRASLSGEVVSIENLSEDQRVLVPSECREENLVAFLGTGMVFDHQPIGVIRLYARDTRSFTNSERRLIKSIGDSAAAAVEQARLLKTKARERRTQRALRIAGTVQKRMLPEVTPRFDRIQLAARYQPSQVIGGDFYDLFEVHNKLGMVVGDVVGKGVVAGMLMSAVRATLRAYADLSEELDRVMIRTNAAVYRDTTVSEFVTIWYGLLCPETMVLSHVVAGHDLPLLFRTDDTGRYRLCKLHGEGMVVGVLPEEQYSMYQHQLEPGDVLLAYTDGITDCANFDRQRFGRARLIESVQQLLDEQPGATAEQVLERVFWSMRQFSGLADQADDETLVVTRIENE